MNSLQQLEAAGELDLTNLGPNDQLVAIMDRVVEWSRIEALGWWEHTSDWDLELILITRDGDRVDYQAPMFHLEIDGETYMPWDLLREPEKVPIHLGTYVPSVTFHITDAMVFGDNGTEEDVSASFALADIAQLNYGRS